MLYSSRKMVKSKSVYPMSLQTDRQTDRQADRQTETNPSYITVFNNASIRPGIVLLRGRPGLFYCDFLNLLKEARYGKDLFVVRYISK